MAPRAVDFTGRRLQPEADAHATPTRDGAAEADIVFTTAADVASVHYAIGDIHGMRDLLDALLTMIEEDAAGARKAIVVLGDFVNRGPATRSVIERLIQGPTDRQDGWIVLRGNHEQLMLEALSGASDAAFRRWIQKGGFETLSSYGLGKKDISPARARRAVPAEHLQFLDALPLSYAIEDFLFVHAGIDPNLPVNRQTSETMMNIRAPFQRDAHKLPFTVVHGHVPSRSAPVVAPGRICVDTGACLTGVLTAVALRPSLPPRFLQTPAQRPTANRHGKL